MEVINAMQAKSGKRTKLNKMGTITQPVQFLPRKEKDESWAAWNLDWLEWNGLKQLRKNARRFAKNYKLAKGIIDKNDYLIEQDNEMRDLVETLMEEDESAFELKFYPIIPNVINVLTAEFAKRDTKITFRAVDDTSYNEMKENKREQIQEVLLADAEQRMMMKLIEAGVDFGTEEGQQQVQQELSPDRLQQLPQIQEYHNKTYRGMCEQWASHLHKVDSERFRIEELEERAFRDMLVTDREFWHFRMMEDDYEVELWNPPQVFYHKSMEARYISQSNWVGKVDMLTIADVIDKYGYLMDEEQLESLEAIYPIKAAGYPIGGYQNDGTFYDGTKSHGWNTNMPGLAYRQFTSMWDDSVIPGGDIVAWLLAETEDYDAVGATNMLRVTTAYWKSQMKVGHLTKIADDGTVTTGIITEEYKVTDEPIYDTTLIKNKVVDNLIFGEHIEWIWINQTWGGVKIGPNRPSFWGMNEGNELSPIYLGIDHNKIRPIKFQFKGDTTLYGCKLPVEGAVFSDRNTKSTSMVDLMKPFQIGYNIVNNQIADILVDELGTIILLDQNTLPRHSLGEDWGKNNLAKAYVAMKNFQMLPLDTTLANTESPLSFQHFQSLNLEQTQRLLSRVQLATYFKQQCMEVVGVTPQRLGQQIGQTQTATGTEQAVIGSYAQTEVYFIQHSDYLMPRVHQMRTDLAQYYNSRQPSTRLSYINSDDEKVNFEINGTDLLLRDINVFSTTNANHRNILEKLKTIMENNNTTGATVYDLGKIMQADSLAELSRVLKNAEEKTMAEAKAQRDTMEKTKQMEVEARVQEKQMELDHDAMEAEKNRRRDILVAEIRAAGYSAAVDLNENKQSDFMDALGVIKQSEEFDQTMSLDRDKLEQDAKISDDKMNIEREKINAQLKMKQIDKEIAIQNKNKYDAPAKKPAEKKNTKKK